MDTQNCLYISQGVINMSFKIYGLIPLAFCLRIKKKHIFIIDVAGHPKLQTGAVGEGIVDTMAANTPINP